MGLSAARRRGGVADAAVGGDGQAAIAECESAPSVRINSIFFRTARADSLRTKDPVRFRGRRQAAALPPRVGSPALDKTRTTNLYNWNS
jgi:hypothetical protein